MYLPRKLYEMYNRKQWPSVPSSRKTEGVKNPWVKPLQISKQVITIRTWNVRSMNLGKLEIVKKESDRTKTDIMGISELRWTGKGHLQSGDKTLYYSGHEDSRKNGVAFLCNQRIAQCVMGYNAINDRLMSIRIQGKPLNVTIIQVYAPTSAATEEEIEQFYGRLEDEIERTPKSDVLYVVGDFNAKVGCKKEAGTIGMWGLGGRNERGQRLLDFCKERNLSAANTMFDQPKQRLYTWTSPNQKYRNQIDYILCMNRWCSSVMNVKTLPGTDCGSDHELLVPNVRLKLRKREKVKVEAKFDTNAILYEYTIAVENRFAMLDASDMDVNEKWAKLKEIITTEAVKHVPKQKIA